MPLEVRRLERVLRDVGGMRDAWRELGGKLGGSWKELGGSLEESWRELGGILEGAWREAGGSLEGACREPGGSLEGTWKQWRAWVAWRTWREPGGRLAEKNYLGVGEFIFGLPEGDNVEGQ
jgi:hypothetical protein